MNDTTEKIPAEIWEKDSYSDIEAEELAQQSLTYLQDVWRRLKMNKSAMGGLVVIVLLVLMAVLGPFFTSYTYYDQDLKNANQPPILGIYKVQANKYVYFNNSLKMFSIEKNGNINNQINKAKEDLRNKQIFYDFDGDILILDYSKMPMRLLDENNNEIKLSKHVSNRRHVLGTDSLGRDLFIRIIYGARISLTVAFIAAIVNLIIGMLYGGISGYIGGTVDMIMMRIVDIISTIPLMLYVILIMVVLNSGFLSIILALGLVYWVNMARIVRGQILSIKKQEFVLAAQTIGTSTKDILLKHLLPNSMGPIIVTMTMLIPSAIFMEAFMSFIGLGVAAPFASWGTLCNDALEALRSYPYQLFMPATAICITMFAFNFLGDGLRDALDPKLRK